MARKGILSFHRARRPPRALTTFFYPLSVHRARRPPRALTTFFYPLSFHRARRPPRALTIFFYPLAPFRFTLCSGNKTNLLAGFLAACSGALALAGAIGGWGPNSSVVNGVSSCVVLPHL